jgi:dipeptidyl aminopeptidase/acylaminoacyl peptidase
MENSLFRRGAAVCGGLIWLLSASWCDAEVKPLTAADSIAATRILWLTGQKSGLIISPDERRYLAFFERGDLARNGTWVQVVSGAADSLDRAGGEVVAELFTTSKTERWNLVSDLRWLADNQTVAFVWDDGEKSTLLSINLRTRERKTLLEYRRTIHDYGLARDGQPRVFTADLDHDSSVSDKMRHDGFAVKDQNIYDLLLGNLDGWTPREAAGLFAISPAQPEPRAIVHTLRHVTLVDASPDGRFALVRAAATSIPEAWDRFIAPNWMRAVMQQSRLSPEIGRIEQLYAVDLEHDRARPLFDAPFLRQNSTGKWLVWSPDSQRVVIGPTFLPLAQADAAGLESYAAAEVDLTTGETIPVPVPFDPAVKIRRPAYSPLRWRDDGVLEFYAVAGKATEVVCRFRKIAGHWEKFDEAPKAESHPAVRVELRPDRSTPPALYGVEAATGRERVLWQSNPTLQKEFSLGRVEEVHWKNRSGQAMTGVLYYPAHFAPGKRFPLTIYLHSFRDDFDLDGVWTTAYAAQPMASRDIAVLLMRWQDDHDTNLISTPDEAPTSMANCESAIEYLSSLGWVDRGKIGLVGFSRPGWHVEYILSHSSFPFAAAITADNFSTNYSAYILALPLQIEGEKDVGATPWGRGLTKWLEASPAFNTDKIHTPLRREIDQGGAPALIYYWEMFGLLRRQGKPVELYIIPDSDVKTAHPLQNPRQRLASQGGAVDWFDFWLNNHERTEPVTIAGETEEQLAEQYARWHRLRDLRDADLKKWHDDQASPPPKQI